MRRHLDLLRVLFLVLFCLVSTELSQRDDTTVAANGLAIPHYLPSVRHDVAATEVPPSPTPTTEPPTPTPVVTGCNPSGGSGGLSSGIHDTTVGGLEALVVVSETNNPQTPTRLVFYLHGDGAGELGLFRNFDNPVMQMVNEKGWIFIVPLAPNEDRRWGNGSFDNTPAFTAALEEMFARYNLCRNALLGFSASGGSWFWSGDFFPETGDTYPTFMILNCGAGGDYPEAQVRDLAEIPGVTARSQIMFTYGRNDFLYPYIQDSIEMYREAGFDVLVDEIPDTGHCAYDIEARTRAYFESILGRLENN